MVISEEYHILESSASSKRRLIVKGSKSGNISLGHKWKDCGAWLQLEDKPAT